MINHSIAWILPSINNDEEEEEEEEEGKKEVIRQASKLPSEQ